MAGHADRDGVPDGRAGIQEALTNVLNHAGKPRTSVRVDYQPGGLVLEVADSGRSAAPAVPPGAGRGLLGLRQRMALYGGELDAGIPVVAEAADGQQAVTAVLKHQPDVVLMDIRMPEMDGLEATRHILAAPARRGCRIIILTTFDLDQYVYAALVAGASGFLLKDVTPEQLVAAVRLVRCGDALLAPSITRRLVERPEQRRAGCRADAQRGHGEDPWGQDLDQARPAGPGPGRGPGLRDRADQPRPQPGRSPAAARPQPGRSPAAARPQPGRS